jgi:hypothetical protein
VPVALRNEAFLVLVVKEGKTKEYLARHSMDAKNCLDFQIGWQRLTKRQPHVCISGEWIGSVSGATEQKVKSWIFDKYKTRLGCDSFAGECDVKKTIREDCGS